jgi:hypothetical protein
MSSPVEVLEERLDTVPRANGAGDTVSRDARRAIVDAVTS